MKGTEKQIAWATEIQTAVAAAMEELIKGISASPRAAEPANQAGIAKLQRALDYIKTGDYYAGNLIDIYKDVNGRDMQADMKTVLSRVRNRFGVSYNDIKMIGE